MASRPEMGACHVRVSGRSHVKQTQREQELGTWKAYLRSAIVLVSPVDHAGPDFAITFLDGNMACTEWRRDDIVMLGLSPGNTAQAHLEKEG